MNTAGKVCKLNAEKLQSLSLEERVARVEQLVGLTYAPGTLASIDPRPELWDIEDAQATGGL
ncbi:MAG TPA: hypothetical protein PKI22_08755 [Hydrogenophilus thermoluteolus]|nr:hypothetical protein [Hydrogenophilus thermoluteolus]